MNLLSIFDPFWPWLMGFSAYLTIGGMIVRSGDTTRIGGVLLAAYALMQLKKLGFQGEYGNIISMTIWCVVAGYLASHALTPRHNYGISTTPLIVAFLLVLSGACYLWGHVAGLESKFLAPHALTADLLAAAAMLIAGHGLGREVVGVLSEFTSLGASHRSGH